MYPFKVFAVHESRIVGDARLLERQQHYDVSKVPVGAEFSLSGLNTYWTSLQAKDDQWVRIVASEGMHSASKLILFPAK